MKSALDKSKCLTALKLIHCPFNLDVAKASEKQPLFAKKAKTKKKVNKPKNFQVKLEKTFVTKTAVPLET